MYRNRLKSLLRCSTRINNVLRHHNQQQRSCLHYDVIIIGGGVMGSASAFFLKQSQPNMKIAVVERDNTYSKAASSLSVASVRQQFSNVENIRLSQWSHEFMCNIADYLTVDEANPPDINLVSNSYMLLATNCGEDILTRNCSLQRECGAHVKCMTNTQLQEEFPWLNTDNIMAGSYCSDKKEGWFDGWSLLSSFQKKNKSIGVDYITGDCQGFQVKSKINAAKVETDDGSIILNGDVFLNAAGPWAGCLMETIGVDLPVTPRKRYVFVFDCPKGPGRSMPMLVDPCGVYCRPDGNGTQYLCGASPCEEEEPDISDLEVNYDYFDKFIWPALAHRIPSMEELKVKHSWAGYYDYNTLDQNAIIGNHHEIENLYFANGFSGHGIQQSPAVGKCISELIIDGKFTSIDLTKLGYDRIVQNKPFIELNII